MKLEHQPMSLAPKHRPSSRAQELAPPSIPKCCRSIPLADFAVLGPVIQQHPRDVQQTLNTEISHGTPPLGWGRCCCLSCVLAGLTPPATLSDSTGCCQHRDAQQHMGEDIPPMAGGAETSPDFIHRGFAAIPGGGKLSHPLLHLPHPNLPASVSHPTHTCAKAPQYGASSWVQLNAEGWNRGEHVWEGARGCRSGLIWPGILAEFSRTVCTVSSLYNGYV